MEDYPINNFDREWLAVGGYVREALSQVSLEVGGEELQTEVLAAAGEEGFPDPHALVLLNSVQPDLGERVITLSAEIQRQTHEREWEAVNKGGLGGLIRVIRKRRGGNT